MGKKKIQIILVIILVIFLLSLRMIHLSADPPVNLSMSAGPYGDPGGYAYNARNKIIFGQWEIDRLNPMYLTLIPHFVTYLSFKLFGVGFNQMNIVPLFFSFLISIVVFFILRRKINRSLAFMAFLLLGINYLFIMYSRIANRIMPMIFFLVLALFFLQKGIKNKNWNFLAGISCFLALMTKGVCIYVVGAIFLGFAVYLALNFRLREALVSFGYYFLGLSLTLLVWIIFIYIPYGYVIKSISDINIQFLIPPKSILKVLSHFWTRPSILFKNSPVIGLLSSFSFLLLLFRAVHKPRKLGLIEWIMLFWFAGGFVYFSIIYQRVTRHFIPQIIPMVFLSTWLIHDLIRSRSITRPKKIKFIFSFAFFSWLLFPTSKLLIPVLEKLPAYLSNVWIATSLLIIIASLLTFLVLTLARLLPENSKIPLSPYLKKTTVLAIFLAVIIFNGRQYLNWALHPQFNLKHISTDLGKALDHAAISGLWAPVICLENKHRAHESYPGYINDEKDFLEKFKITHVFATTFFNGLEINYYRRNFPISMKRAKLLAKYFIWRGTALLYELKPHLKNSKGQYYYEAEIYTQPQGMPRYDPYSSGKFAVLARKKQAGFIAIASSKEKISKGSYKVIFKMKKEGSPSKPHSRIARIDVVSIETKKILSIKNLYSENFNQEKNYQEFSIPVDLKKPLKLDFRAYSDGVINIWIDAIRIARDSK